MEIAVVGGSLGGIIAGCLLADDGHSVTIYERSPVELEERGAGIGFLAATGRYLKDRAGVDLTTISVETHYIRHLARDGSVAHTLEQYYLMSSWNTVYREMMRCFDRSRYLLGHELISLDAPSARLEFSNGLTVQPDLAVCADGVGSTARSLLLPEVTTEYSGYVAWRGVIPETALTAATRAVLDDAVTFYALANSYIIIYPIPGRDGSVAVGERLINIVWYRNYLAPDDLADLMRDRRGVAREVSMPPGTLRDEHIAECRAVAVARLPPPIAEVVCSIPELFIQVVLDLSVDRMVFGRTCLLGDAAFVVRPHAAAGTAKAAADGWTLREAIAAHPNDVEAALAAWEPGQLDLGRSLTERTRVLGRRSQTDSAWIPGAPDTIFGLYRPGD